MEEGSLGTSGTPSAVFRDLSWWGEGGLHQSHRAIGAEATDVVCTPSENSWLPREEAVGGKLPLSVNTFWNFPSGLVGKTVLPLQGLLVESLVGT